MSKPHKWAKEIKAWADGAEIEFRLPTGTWKLCDATEEPPQWLENVDYRIKPQPKEPQYLYVYANTNGEPSIFTTKKPYEPYLGKIKLETDND